VTYSLKKPKAFFWSTNHSFPEIQEKLAKGKVTEEWLVCPLGEAKRAVTLSELIARPALFEAIAKTVTGSTKPDQANSADDTDLPLGIAFDRRHDLDALRASAMLLGIGLHAALAYLNLRIWPIYDDRHRRAPHRKRRGSQRFQQLSSDTA